MDIIGHIRGHRDELSPVQEVADPMLDTCGIRLLVKRDDLLHPVIQGNKWRKLRYSLMEAARSSHHSVLTFGGAFSNHIAATAAACRMAGLDSIGLIRGEELQGAELNPTLRQAAENGMELHFIPREDYRLRHSPDYLAGLQARFGRCHVVPEGGASEEGVRGCEEILPEVTVPFDTVCCAAGTGTTLAGLLRSLPNGARLIGFPALKDGGFLRGEAIRLAELRGRLHEDAHSRLSICDEFHFGGYAKVNDALLRFIQRFADTTGIPLDPLYTGKMMFGIYQLTERRFFQRGETVLVLHTGGLQGWYGLRHRGVA